MARRLRAVGPRGCGSMAERKLPKLETGVRFPSPAPGRWSCEMSSSPLRQVPRSGGAQILEWAELASVRRRLADLASEPDQPHVQRGPEPVGNQIVQQPVGALGARLRGNQAQTTGDAVHVRIDRDRVAAQGEGQHDRRGLRTDAGKGGEVAARLRVRHASEPRQVVGALALVDLAKDGLDAWGLRVGGAAGAGRIREGGRGRRDDLTPGGERVAERRERPVGVHVARVLAQNREDQLVEGIGGTRWRQWAEAAFETPEDRSDTPRRRVRVRHRPGWYGTRPTRTDRALRCGTASATAR